jgi:hypothetical protein
MRVVIAITDNLSPPTFTTVFQAAFIAAATNMEMNTASDICDRNDHFPSSIRKVEFDELHVHKC